MHLNIQICWHDSEDSMIPMMDSVCELENNAIAALATTWRSAVAQPSESLYL